MRILGIDPGTGRLGYGVAEKREESYICHATGCLTTPKNMEQGPRLASLHDDLVSIIQSHTLAGAVVERVYFSKNTRTALQIAEARGMILLTLQKHHIPIIELSPQHVKMGVTGYGSASKEQVQRMVQQLFMLSSLPTPDDAADALALAFAGLSYFTHHKE